ncbi:MAG: flagellar biosynthetic protein FliO [Deltaproteobacteria bacterium]|nr:flagellar biosynthetic protein FliO [Deltaproteobacteria bacterium]
MGLCAALVACLAASTSTTVTVEGASFLDIAEGAALLVRTNVPPDRTAIRASAEGALLYARLPAALAGTARTSRGVRLKAYPERASVDVTARLPAVARCGAAPVVTPVPEGFVLRVNCAPPPPPSPAVPEATTPPAAIREPPPAQPPPVPVAPGVTAAAVSPVAAEPRSPVGVALAAALLLVLGAVALWMRRRRGAPPDLLSVVQTFSLGPRRSLVMARVDGRMLLLSNSEAGIHLVTEVQGARSVAASPLPGRNEPGQAAAVMRGAFERVLDEVGEDELLRRKMAAAAHSEVH